MSIVVFPLLLSCEAPECAHTFEPLNKIGKVTVTQQMVADAVGVHLSTVSLALRNDPRLPEETRTKIRAIAQKMGYAPNPLVSLLMSRVRRRNAGYRGTLGYLHTVPSNTPKLGGHVHRNFVGGARKRATALGYNLDELFLTDDNMSPRRIVRTLQARSIAGLVIEHTPTPLCPGRKLPFDVTPFAVATLCVPLAEPLHYVANDQYMRAIVASRELLAHGYRRIGLVVVGTFDSGMAHRCTAGFWAVQEYMEGIERVPILRIKDRNEERAFRTWLERHKPDAILTTSAILPEFLATAGLRVPADIGWATLDWTPEHKQAAGVYGNSEHTGAAAVDLVVSQLHRGEAGPPAHAMNYLVAGSWMPGKTLRKVGPPLDLDASFFADFGKA